MKIIQKSKEKVVFAEEVSESLANAIRRSVNEIPILAIDEVEFYKNDSVLYDEIIAHRLGLIPLKNENLELREDCTCKEKGCVKCTISLKLKAKGPATIYSSNLKGKAEPIYGSMPITVLSEDQELEFSATARLGKGKEHIKFSPGIFYYRNMAEIEVDKNCNLCKKCVEACPQKILSIDKKPELKDVYKCDLCEACVEACKKEGKNAIIIKPGKELIFFIESFGQIDADDIFIEAVNALKNNLKQVK